MKEFEYVQAALETAGLVVVVSSISKSASLNRRKLEYISPNAEILGINAEALKQGYRLIDDYVHPNDRDKFNEAVTMSLSQDENFSYEVRNIGDDGYVRNVNVDIIHLPDRDGNKLLEFIIREIPKTSQVSEVRSVQEPRIDGMKKINAEFFREQHIDDIVNGFASVCELYSVVLDINGKKLIEPTGPATYLGEFHEMVFNPKHRKLYDDIVNCIADSGQAMYSEIDDGNPDSRLAAAPIFIDGKFYATWVLYAHTKGQNQKLFKAFEHFSKNAEILSDTITRLYVGSVASGEEENIKYELDFERNAKEIMGKVLKVVAAGDRTNILELYENVGKLLDVDYIVYYAVDRQRVGHMNLVDYWARTGKSKEAEDVFGWENDHYDVELQNKIKTEGLVIDKKNMTNQMRVEIFKGNARAVMVFPINYDDTYIGRLIFIENSRERIWSKREVSFARDIAAMISTDIAIRKRIHKSRRGSKVILDIFDTLPVYLFVRNVETGKVIYANPMLKEKMGFDITGQDSFTMIPNVQEEYEGMNEAMNDAIYNGSEKYKRYIDKLDGIYDVTEYFMTWNDGSKVSVLVMTPEE